jgi:hypothetical protein
MKQKYHHRALKPNSLMEQRFCLKLSMICHGVSSQYEFVEMQKTTALNTLMSSKAKTKIRSNRKVMSIK